MTHCKYCRHKGFSWLAQFSFGFTLLIALFTTFTLAVKKHFHVGLQVGLLSVELATVVTRKLFIGKMGQQMLVQAPPSGPFKLLATNVKNQT